MRRVLVRHERDRRALKRGGDRHRTTLDGQSLGLTDERIDLLDLHEALERLEEKDPRAGRLVVLRFFGGLDWKDCEAVLGVSESTIHRWFAFARAWLQDYLSTEDR